MPQKLASILVMIAATFLSCASATAATPIMVSRDTFVTHHRNLGGADTINGDDEVLRTIAPFEFATYSLLYFDVSQLNGMILTEDPVVNLDLVEVFPAVPGTREIFAYEVFTAWDNSTSWNSFGATPGVQYGTDFSASPISSSSFAWNSPDDNGLVQITIPNTLVQTWIDDPSRNFGFGLTHSFRDLEFASLESTIGESPSLTINLAPIPEPSTLLLVILPIASILILRRRTLVC